MGWKNIKEHFQIQHNVCITDRGICIGSGYVHDLAVINPKTGEVSVNSTFSDFLKNNYPSLASASKSEIFELISRDDTFTASLTVYTYDGCEIIEKQCEEYGWPNVTHDGEQMYDNTFFSDKIKAIESALENAKAGVSLFTDERGRLMRCLEEANTNLAKCRNDVRALECALGEGD